MPGAEHVAGGSGAGHVLRPPDGRLTRSPREVPPSALRLSSASLTPAPFETRYIHFRYRPPLFTPHALPLTAVLSVPS